MTETGSLIPKPFGLLAEFAILTSAAMNDSIEWRPPFKEMEFEFLKFFISWFPLNSLFS